MKRLSIIIPMYNVEPYVERCLRSLEDQDISRDEYEIICINDGSPDNCRGVVEALQREFDNIILINQENQGVSRARNKGMDLAAGSYLLMVDPDDYLQPNVLKERLEIMDYHSLDVGLTGYTILNESFEEEYRFDPMHETKRIHSGIEILNSYRKDKPEIVERDPHRSWAVFYRTSFLNTNKLRYLADVPYLEDGELMARIMCLAEKVTFINGPVYMRTTRPGSATHSRLFNSKKGRDGFIKAAYNLYHFRQEHCRSSEQEIFINENIVHFTILPLISLEGLDYFRFYSELHTTLKKGALRKLETAGIRKWYRKLGRYYNRSMHCLYLYWLIHRMRESMKWRLKRIFT